MAKRTRFPEAVENAPQVESVPNELPQASPKQALDDLQAALAMPESNRGQRAEKAAKVAAAGKVWGQVQQGLPVLALGADQLAAVKTETSDDLRLTRLKIIARSNLDVAWLLKQFESRNQN